MNIVTNITVGIQNVETMSVIKKPFNVYGNIFFIIEKLRRFNQE